MTVYILEHNFGDYKTWSYIAEVFDSEQKAIEAKDAFIAKKDRTQAIPEPESENEKMTYEECTEWHEWHMLQQEYREYFTSTINPYDVS